ncbi:MAG: exodeoxyribonuclease VII large subunit [Parachlamydiales bacterium]|nr:exodeoxyribonuclease VII large subunit [Parachlamydiales bacterium]
MESQQIFTVSDLTQAIKACIEPPFRFLCVQGEVSNCTLHSSGHLYFTLKDAQAQISAVLFKGFTQGITRLPKAGDQITVKGDLTVYPPRGGYQILVKNFTFSGKGELLLMLEERKEKLKERGWFDQKHKKSLPLLPQKIGVITSPTGAVIQDIVHVLTRRFHNFHLLLNPVKVQGEGAAEEIAKAIKDCNQYNVCDLLIIARGGGSIEDLWPFNEEIVAEAIFHSRIPIISAVGHETDYSIADFVADVRAPTPSAAAEIALKEKIQLYKTLETSAHQITFAIRQKILAQKKALFQLAKHPLFSSPYTLLKIPLQLLDELQEKLFHFAHHFLHKKREKIIFFERQTRILNPRIKIHFGKQQIQHLTLMLENSMQNYLKLLQNALVSKNFLSQIHSGLLKSIQIKRQSLTLHVNTLKALDPQNLLEKGYSICFSEKKGSIILSAEQVEKDDPIFIQLYDGKLLATIKEKIK